MSLPRVPQQVPVGGHGNAIDTCALDDFISRWQRHYLYCLHGWRRRPKGVNMLAQYIHEEYPMYKVAWYSGRLRIPSMVCKTDFDYIKIGPYIRHLGPLNKPTTNQRMYHQTDNGTFEDITERFWKK